MKTCSHQVLEPLGKCSQHKFPRLNSCRTSPPRRQNRCPTARLVLESLAASAEQSVSAEQQLTEHIVLRKPNARKGVSETLPFFGRCLQQQKRKHPFRYVSTLGRGQDGGFPLHQPEKDTTRRQNPPSPIQIIYQAPSIFPKGHLCL